MAKQTMDVLKLAEEKAKQTLIDAKTEADRIIKEAEEKKIQILKNFENESKKTLSQAKEKAMKEAEKIETSLNSENEKNVIQLQTSFKKNVELAKEKIIQTIVN